MGDDEGVGRVSGQFTVAVSLNGRDPVPVGVAHYLTPAEVADLVRLVKASLDRVPDEHVPREVRGNDLEYALVACAVLFEHMTGALSKGTTEKQELETSEELEDQDEEDAAGPAPTDILADMLSLVLAVRPSEVEVGAWSAEEKIAAERWAAVEHANAHGEPTSTRPERPACVGRLSTLSPLERARDAAPAEGSRKANGKA